MKSSRITMVALALAASFLLTSPASAATCSDIKRVQTNVNRVVAEMKQGQRTPVATVDEVERLLGTINGVAESDVQTVKVVANKLRSENASAAEVEAQVKRVLARFAESQRTCT